jgi:hypothetical protein
MIKTINVQISAVEFEIFERAMQFDRRTNRSSVIRDLMIAYANGTLPEEEQRAIREGYVAADPGPRDILECASKLCNSDKNNSCSVIEILDSMRVQSCLRKRVSMQVGRLLRKAGYKLYQPRALRGNKGQLRRYRRYGDYVAKILSYSRKPSVE